MSDKSLLWLDDYRNPFETTVDWLKFSPIGRDCNVIWVKDYDEFCNYIMNNPIPDAICFDHDLGEGLNGYDCAKFLINYLIDNNIKEIPVCNYQTSNPVGKENIRKLINNFKEFISKQQLT